MKTNKAIIEAYQFAEEKHKKQRRMNTTKIREPYIVHPLAVYGILAGVGEVNDTATLVAALLHDTLEDTDTSQNEIETLFWKRCVRLSP